jgi:hypothetical protein
MLLLVKAIHSPAYRRFSAIRNLYCELHNAYAGFRIIYTGLACNRAIEKRKTTRHHTACNHIWTRLVRLQKYCVTDGDCFISKVHKRSAGFGNRPIGLNMRTSNSISHWESPARTSAPVSNSCLTIVSGNQPTP